jgi:hypothetical protein
MIKLDTTLCSVDWEVLFPDCMLQSSATQDSDHCPLILDLHDLMCGKRRFHFESFWPQLDELQDTVASAWVSMQLGPCTLWSLTANLKVTTKSLLSWSDKRIDHIASQLELAKELIHQIDIAQDKRALSFHKR